MLRLTNANCHGERHARGCGYRLVTTFAAWSMLGLTLQGCGVRPCSPSQLHERTRIDLDERVDDWRVNGETISQRFIHAADGCYLLEVKYSEDYKRVHGASSLWGVSPVAAAIDTASRTHTSHYETGYVPFAVQLRGQHTYYVTATFDGDEFRARVVELNAAAERTREFLPVRSAQELDSCRARSPGAQDIGDVVCTVPVANTGGLH
jgi:hypothetical protein